MGDTGSRGLSILVVESNAPVRSLLSRELTKQGYRVSIAVGSSDAIHSIMRDGVPTAIVVSKALKRESGLDLLNALEVVEKTRGLPAVLLVADKGEYDRLANAELADTVAVVLKHPNLPVRHAAIVGALEDSKGLSSAKQDANQASEDDFADRKDQIVGLDNAVSAMERVAKMVAEDRLPGPVMPKLLSSVRELMSDEDVDFKDVETFVQKHQTLSVKLLALANSALYSHGGKVGTISQALARLGLTKSSELLMTVAAKEFIVGKNRKLRELISNCLREAYLVAVLAQDMIQRTARSLSNEVYTLAMFHNIGQTFFVYTLALLDSKGKLGDFDMASLETMSSKKCGELNKLICQQMRLPTEVGTLFSQQQEAEGVALDKINCVMRAMWAANKLIANPDQDITFDPDGVALEVGSEWLDAVNERRTTFVDLMKSYI